METVTISGISSSLSVLFRAVPCIPWSYRRSQPRSNEVGLGSGAFIFVLFRVVRVFSGYLPPRLLSAAILPSEDNHETHLPGEKDTKRKERSKHTSTRNTRNEIGKDPGIESRTVRWAAILTFLLICSNGSSAQPPDPRDNATPYWSHGRIYFKSNRDGGGVYSVKPNGEDLELLIKSTGDSYPPRWTKDGKRGVFMTNRDGGDFEIYSTNSDGSQQVRLTTNKGYDWDPGWSPDGRKIVFMSAKDGNWEIYTMNADGSNPVRLTNNTAKDFSPAFSPDGKKIVFASDRGGNEDIYTMNADGGGAVVLAPATGFDGTPEWSHDGKWIVFHSRRDGGKAEIYVMRSDGTSLTRLTTNDATDVYPAFSSDNKKLVFQSDRDGHRDLYVMNADGTRQIRLMTPSAAANAQP